MHREDDSKTIVVKTAGNGGAIYRFNLTMTVYFSLSDASNLAQSILCYFSQSLGLSYVQLTSARGDQCATYEEINSNEQALRNIVIQQHNEMMEPLREEVVIVEEVVDENAFVLFKEDMLAMDEI